MKKGKNIFFIPLDAHMVAITWVKKWKDKQYCSSTYYIILLVSYNEICLRIRVRCPT